MAIQTQNVVMQGVSRKIGRTLVFRQMKNGTTVIAQRPKPRSKPVTAAEALTHDRFRAAAHIAKKRSQDPMLRPQYLARAQPGQSAYFVALKEYLNAHKTNTTADTIHRSVDAVTARVNKPAEINLEIAKFNIIAANNMLVQQRMAIFASQSLINTERTARPAQKNKQTIRQQTKRMPAGGSRSNSPIYNPSGVCMDYVCQFDVLNCPYHTGVKSP